ncbi:response regulator [Methylogaea oryzae]|uniref:Response regulator n=1 Tax=Methylogaea oryzae TaxID=1295382 RepID=A0A8D4VRG4_9GAMM|nr:response regulator [Methylogaea oryzae]BBL72486.1 hypothetical protein MoryE10_30920 [Methylogaea oryzae]
MADQEHTHTLLLVDDEPLILEALKRAFRKRYEVLTADSGDDAIALLRSRPVDLIICDQRMPRVTGVEVLKQALELQPDAVRILLTGYSDSESLIRCINEAQIYKYIAKPWQPEMVWLTVIRALESLDLKRQLQQSMELLQQQKDALDKSASVAIADIKGVIRYVNDRFCAACGYGTAELIGKNVADLRSAQHPPAFYALLQQTVTGGRIWHGDICHQRKNGEFYWIDTSIVPLTDQKGRPYRYVAIGKELPPQ